MTITINETIYEKWSRMPLRGGSDGQYLSLRVQDTWYGRADEWTDERTGLRNRLADRLWKDLRTNWQTGNTRDATRYYTAMTFEWMEMIRDVFVQKKIKLI